MSLKDKFLGFGKQSNALIATPRKSRILSALALFLAISAFGAAGVAPMAPDAANLPVKSITETLALPTLEQQVEALSGTPQHYVSEEVIRNGDTLASLMTRLGVNDDAAANFIKSDATARGVLQLKAGKRVQAKASQDGALEWLTMTVPDPRDNGVKTIEIRRNGSGFKAVDAPARLETRVEMKSGSILSSLFAATDAVQIPDNVTMQLVDMFSTNIDFASDLKRGDRFNVVYETLWQNGELVRSGRVLAAEFTNAGKMYQTVWFDDPKSKDGGGYFAFDGTSLKKAFLKSPLEFSRITSGFSMRTHPISGKWKAHEGVDFAASTGTPIRAAADGVIDSSGSQNGYGNVVVIKHWNGVTTIYAHMSRFAPGARKGAKVRQGEVIGFVGSTGWATGPHLHYEFRVNNQPRNPLTVDVPNPQPLAAADMQRFRQVTTDMTHRFALLAPEKYDIKLAVK
jgi:murein DD-endopeptidase MepM/ murein hydrolase activator NlpD